MSQEIKSISVNDLVLWSENPRDKIDPNADNQSIVDLALHDSRGKWSLPKLAKEMGDEFDFSELPTVVYHQAVPVVYDGNRRVILAKIKNQLVNNNSGLSFEIPNFPKDLPCNVCTKDVALKNILRKHGDSGSWSPLERDIFLNKHMGEIKSPFLVIEEKTGLISSNPHLNQRFVKEEVFKEDVLSALGFEVKGGNINSKHDYDDAMLILMDISNKIKDKELSTRKNRGEVINILDQSSKSIIAKNKAKTSRILEQVAATPKVVPQVLTRRVSIKPHQLFGGKLALKAGSVNNLYRDIAEIYQLYLDKKTNFSSSFIGLIRMSFRLLVEMACADLNLKLGKYITTYFAKAKETLDQSTKTKLSNDNVTESTLEQLLHTGAHNYQTSLSVDAAISMSIIIGAMLTLSHGKNVNE